MNEVITREFINSQIEIHQLRDDQVYYYDDLCKRIDMFKNILVSESDGPVSGKRLIVGMMPSLSQIACIFACFELGITLCIVDFNRPDQFQQYEYMDPKTELLTPIDFFIVAVAGETNKFQYFQNVCKRTIVLDQIQNPDYSKNQQINATAQSPIMICTSSGTTGTPKIIEHSHRFMFHLAKRNSKMYDDNVGITHNLNHGSSFATFFLPALHSVKVKAIYNGDRDFTDQHNVKFLNAVDHIMAPYNHIAMSLTQSNFTSECTVYTLSAISEQLAGLVRSGRFRDVVSFFGSNETSGPIMVNQASLPDFTTNTFAQLDDFYDINLIDNELHVTLPYYKNHTVNTQDRFHATDSGKFKFLGRKDLKRINGMIVPDDMYHHEISTTGISHYALVFDFQESQIYIAVQDISAPPELPDKIACIQSTIQQISQGRHNIDKFAVLDFSEFMTGVKLDHELLRHYFRNYTTNQNAL